MTDSKTVLPSTSDHFEPTAQALAAKRLTDKPDEDSGSLGISTTTMQVREDKKTTTVQVIGDKSETRFAVTEWLQQGTQTATTPMVVADAHQQYIQNRTPKADDKCKGIIVLFIINTLSFIVKGACKLATSQIDLYGMYKTRGVIVLPVFIQTDKLGTDKVATLLAILDHAIDNEFENPWLPPLFILTAWRDALALYRELLLVDTQREPNACTEFLCAMTGYDATVHEVSERHSLIKQYISLRTCFVTPLGWREDVLKEFQGFVHRLDGSSHSLALKLIKQVQLKVFASIRDCQYTITQQLRHRGNYSPIDEKTLHVFPPLLGTIIDQANMERIQDWRQRLIRKSAVFFSSMSEIEQMNVQFQAAAKLYGRDGDESKLLTKLITFSRDIPRLPGLTDFKWTEDNNPALHLHNKIIGDIGAFKQQPSTLVANPWLLVYSPTSFLVAEKLPTWLRLWHNLISNIEAIHGPHNNAGIHMLKLS